MGAKTLLTVEHLERLPEIGDVSYELDQGELVEVSSAGYLHSRIRGRVERFLGMHLDAHPGQREVVAEQWFVLAEAADAALLPGFSARVEELFAV